MAGVDVAVNVAFKARDGLSRALDRIAAKAQGVRTRMQKFFSKLNKMAIRSRSIMGGVFGGMMLSQGIFALTMGLRKVTEEFLGMDQAVTGAAAKFPEMIARGTKEFEKLEMAARRIGAATEFTSREAAEGLEFMAMAGFNASQAMAALPAVVDLATGANMDMARATDIATDALGAFNLASQDSSQLTENLTRINDVFARTVTSSNVTLEHMFESMKDGGPTLTTAGQSVETFAALIGTMGNAGIKGSKAGTTLKNMALRLAAPMGKGAAMIKKLGISVADSSGDMRDMLDILQDLETATAKMGTQQKSAALEAIFGKRAIAGMNVVLSKGIKNVRNYRSELELAAGSSQELAEEMRKSIGNRLKVLQASIIEMGFKFIEAFQKKFPNALDDTIDAIQQFDPKPLLDGFETMIDLGKKVVDFYIEWKPWIVAVAGAFVGLTLALKAAALALAIVNILALLNPFILLAMGIGAAIALLWVYWDDVQAWAGGFVETFFGVADQISLSFQNLWAVIKNTFVTVWDSILDFMKSGMKWILESVGSVSSVLGLDFDTSGALKQLDDLYAGARVEKREIKSFEQVRKERQESMGLPTSTLAEGIAQSREQKSRIDMSGYGQAQKATMFKSVIDPETLKGAFDQSTDVNIDLDFKNLMAQFDQSITVDASAFSTDGETNTKVNKKRAGAN